MVRGQGYGGEILNSENLVEDDTKKYRRKWDNTMKSSHFLRPNLDSSWADAMVNEYLHIFFKVVAILFK